MTPRYWLVADFVGALYGAIVQLLVRWHAAAPGADLPVSAVWLHSAYRRTVSPT